MTTRKSQKSQQIATLNETTEQVNEMSNTEIPVLKSAIEQVKALLEEMDISTIRQAVEYACQIIKEREEVELSEIDRQIAELNAKRDSIRPKPVQVETNGKRDLKPLIGPNGEQYVAGRRPDWLTEMAKKDGIDTDNGKAMHQWISKKRAEQQ